MDLPSSCRNNTVETVPVDLHHPDWHQLNTTVVDALLQVQGDTAGLGVRLSFYLQTFVLVLLANRSPEDAPGALWTLTATSCGLTVAAVVQLCSRNLSLLEAILVSQLVWLANFASFIAAASYSRSRGKDNVVKFVTVGQGYFSMILTIVMWSEANKLGQFPECNGLVKFVVLFAIETPALGNGRMAALVCSSLLLCGYTFLTLEELAAWWKHRTSRTAKNHHHKRQRRRVLRQRIGDAQRTPFLRGMAREAGTRNKWSLTGVDPIFVGVILVESIVFAYFVTTTELLIQNTRVFQPANHQWGFGQVFAVMVVTPSVVSLYRGMRENKMKRRKDDRHRIDIHVDGAVEEGRRRSRDTRESASRRPSENLTADARLLMPTRQEQTNSSHPIT